MTALIILGAIAFFAWDLYWRAAGVEPISPARLKKLLEESSDMRVLVDVRTSREYEAFHIREAEHIPNLLSNLEALDMRHGSMHVVVICMSGHRSAIIAFRLKKQGFRHVSYLAWGMIAWAVSGGPMVIEKKRNR